MDQPGVLGIAAKSLDGTVEAARSLGLVGEGSTELTALGRRFVLASPPERIRILRGAMLAFAPYGRVLDAVRERGEAETEAGWVETWWGAHGFGGSQSNRAEAAASLGRLVEHVGLGDYIPGRRGHPTRVRWNQDALHAAFATGRSGGSIARAPGAAPATEGVEGGLDATETEAVRARTPARGAPMAAPDVNVAPEVRRQGAGPGSGRAPLPGGEGRGAGARAGHPERSAPLDGDRAWEGSPTHAGRRPERGPNDGWDSLREDLSHADRGEDAGRSGAGHPARGSPDGREHEPARPRQSRVVLPLGEGRVARLSVPAVLTAAEKRRLLSLVDLLVEVRGE